jgi:vitamin B12 transporter
MRKRAFILCCLLPALALGPLYPQETDKAESAAAGDTGAEPDREFGGDYDDDYFDSGEDEGITVTGTPETTAQVKVVSKDEIDRIAAPDIPTLLEEALDIGITRHGAYGNSSGINIRGFNTERIAILIDGVPVNSAMSGDFDFNTIDMNSIERIEVIYGGSDSKFNVTGALGGVVNIITVKNQKPGLHFSAGMSNISYMPDNYIEWDTTEKDPQWGDLLDTQQLNFSLSYGSDKFSWGAHVFGNNAGNHYIYTDSYLYEVRRKQFNEIWDIGGGILFSWNFPNLSKLLVNTDVYYSDKDIPSSGFSSIVGVQNDFTTRENVMFEMPVAFRDDLSAEFSLSHSWAHMNYKPTGQPLSEHDQQSITMINRWGWYLSEAVVLRVGWDYRYVYIDSTGTGQEDRHDGGMYLTAEFTLFKALHVIPSVKAVTDGAGIVPVPKLGFFWTPSDFFTLKNNYYRSFKYPDFDDLYWSGGGSRGNPSLKPEDGWGADLGAEFRWREFFTAESTFFAQWTKDSIHWHRTFGNAWEPQNIGEAAFFGSDTRIKVNFPVSWGPVKKISPGFSYQYLLSYLLSYGYTWEDEQRIPYQPMHTYGASLDISWGSGSLLISTHYESLRYYSITNLIELDPYFLVNVNINQKIGEHLTVYSIIRNLLNESYESYNRYPMPGLSLTLGFRVNF